MSDWDDLDDTDFSEIDDVCVAYNAIMYDVYNLLTEEQKQYNNLYNAAVSLCMTTPLDNINDTNYLVNVINQRCKEKIQLDTETVYTCRIDYIKAKCIMSAPISYWYLTEAEKQQKNKQRHPSGSVSATGSPIKFQNTTYNTQGKAVIKWPTTQQLREQEEENDRWGNVLLHLKKPPPQGNKIQQFPPPQGNRLLSKVFGKLTKEEAIKWYEESAETNRQLAKENKIAFTMLHNEQYLRDSEMYMQLAAKDEQIANNIKNDMYKK